MTISNESRKHNIEMFKVMSIAMPSFVLGGLGPSFGILVRFMTSGMTTFNSGDAFVNYTTSIPMLLGIAIFMHAFFTWCAKKEEEILEKKLKQNIDTLPREINKI